MYLGLHNTIVGAPTNTTRNSLIYVCEVIIPLEIQTSSLRTVLAMKMTTKEKTSKLTSEVKDIKGIKAK